MESNASRALTCVENTGRDPYFLPKEVFHRLLLPLEASTKARCIRINKAWKPELKGDTTIWRECKIGGVGDLFLGSSTRGPRP